MTNAEIQKKLEGWATALPQPTDQRARQGFDPMIRQLEMLNGSLAAIWLLLAELVMRTPEVKDKKE